MVKTSLIAISFFLLIVGCISSQSSPNHPIESVQNKTVDTTLFLEVDDYPFTDNLLKDTIDQYAMHKLKAGNFYSLEKVWFTNDDLDETIIIELATDYHRYKTYHFQNNPIPESLVDLMEFHIFDKSTYEVASKNNNEQALEEFIKQSRKVDAKYFKSDLGIQLGDPKSKLIKEYGKPDSTILENGFEVNYWTFSGDMGEVNVGKTSRKKMAFNSFGHSVIVYFKNDKLVARLMKNEIP